MKVMQYSDTRITWDYTYNDECRTSHTAISTDWVYSLESKSNNPFAYYTGAVTNSFVGIINIEKNQNIRNDDAGE